MLHFYLPKQNTIKSMVRRSPCSFLRYNYVNIRFCPFSLCLSLGLRKFLFRYFVDFSNKRYLTKNIACSISFLSVCKIVNVMWIPFDWKTLARQYSHYSSFFFKLSKAFSQCNFLLLVLSLDANLIAYKV